jgi:hypothetical protein
MLIDFRWAQHFLCKIHIHSIKKKRSFPHQASVPVLLECVPLLQPRANCSSMVLASKVVALPGCCLNLCRNPTQADKNRRDKLDSQCLILNDHRSVLYVSTVPFLVQPRLFPGYPSGRANLEHHVVRHGKKRGMSLFTEVLRQELHLASSTHTPGCSGAAHSDCFAEGIRCPLVTPKGQELSITYDCLREGLSKHSQARTASGVILGVGVGQFQHGLALYCSRTFLKLTWCWRCST